MSYREKDGIVAKAKTSARVKQVTQAVTVPQRLQDFVNARNRPAVFLFLSEPLSIHHAAAMRRLLGDSQYHELDLVVNSGGGDIHAAYQIVELLRRHTEVLNACVPFYAKSAATLLCVGADRIYVDELAQLGPLDPQIWEETRGGKGQFSSALNPFKTLEQLQAHAVESLDMAMKVIVARSGLDVDACLKHAVEFVRASTGPLFMQLQPEKFGTYSRELSVAEEYGTRLLTRYRRYTEGHASALIRRLVHDYPSHAYIIDYPELKELGLPVELFAENERPAVQHLLDICTGTEQILQIIHPTTTPQPERTSKQE